MDIFRFRGNNVVSNRLECQKNLSLLVVQKSEFVNILMFDRNWWMKQEPANNGYQDRIRQVSAKVFKSETDWSGWFQNFGPEIAFLQFFILQPSDFRELCSSIGHVHADNRYWMSLIFHINQTSFQNSIEKRASVYLVKFTQTPQFIDSNRF